MGSSPCRTALRTNRTGTAPAWWEHNSLPTPHGWAHNGCSGNQSQDCQSWRDPRGSWNKAVIGAEEAEASPGQACPGGLPARPPPSPAPEDSLSAYSDPTCPPPPPRACLASTQPQGTPATIAAPTSSWERGIQSQFSSNLGTAPAPRGEGSGPQWLVQTMLGTLSATAGHRCGDCPCAEKGRAAGSTCPWAETRAGLWGAPGPPFGVLASESHPSRGRETEVTPGCIATPSDGCGGFSHIRRSGEVSLQDPGPGGGQGEPLSPPQHGKAKCRPLEPSGNSQCATGKPRHIRSKFSPHCEHPPAPSD